MLRPCARRWYDGGIARRAHPLAHAAIALLPLTAAACGDDEPSPAEARADQVADAARQAGLPDDAVELLADAARADGTYQVTYELEDRHVVVTQRPPDRRVDTVADDGSIDAEISVDGRTHACSKPPDGEWQCEDLGTAPPEGTFDPAAVVDLADALTASASDYDFSVERRDIAGADARCLVARGSSASAADGTLCIADTGAILLVERPAGTLRASDYTTELPDDAFDLPA